MPVSLHLVSFLEQRLLSILFFETKERGAREDPQEKVARRVLNLYADIEQRGATTTSPVDKPLHQVKTTPPSEYWYMDKTLHHATSNNHFFDSQPPS
jgi:hypothetical protein